MYDPQNFTVDAPHFNLPIIAALAIACWLPVAALAIVLV